MGYAFYFCTLERGLVWRCVAYCDVLTFLFVVFAVIVALVIVPFVAVVLVVMVVPMGTAPVS